MTKIRIVLADDHETVREGLKAILSAYDDLEVIAEAENGQEAVSQASTLHPDIVIMDVSMPVMNGLDATKSITCSFAETKVLVLTRHGEEAYLQQLLRAGASGYVLKQSRANVLVGAVRAIAAGKKYLDPAVTAKVIGGFNRPSASSHEAHSSGTISSREEEVLRMVAWGYSNKDIANELGLSVKTVETHKANATAKLGLTERSDIVRFAVLKGWLKDA
jgi:DNA-binding NarL/FixJ family response regulator